MYSFTLVVLLVWKFALSKEDFLSYFLTRSNLWESPRQSRGFTSINYLSVFRFAGTTAFLCYAVALWQNSIWDKRAWSTTAKSTFDGLVYALVTAGVFGWLWPSY